MPLVLLIVGVLFLVAAIRGNDEVKTLTDTLKGDFTGPNNFLQWALAVGAVAGLQYVPRLRPLSYALMGLVFLALILSHKQGGSNVIVKFFNTLSGK